MSDLPPPSATLRTLFEKRFAAVMSPLESFIRLQTTASILLIGLSLAALVFYNSPLEGALRHVADASVGLAFGSHVLAMSLNEFVSQGLMAFFFFLTGLEIKREILAGKLSGRREVALTVVSAAGGIIIPALIYYLINHGGSGQHGWGIPTATDTAFAIGVLALFAARISVGLGIFFTALAIFDDVGAIVIISIFYAHDIDTHALLYSGIIFSALVLANKAGVRTGWFYGIMGLLLWYFVFATGIHATLAGILLALTIPARTIISESRFLFEIRALTAAFERREDTDVSILGSSGKHSIVSAIGRAVKSASTPLQNWESSLVMPIAIVILPLFAFLNAGFRMTPELVYQGAVSPVTWGIIVGLVLGKPLGIVSFGYLFSLTRWGRLPAGVSFQDVVGVGFLAGIGFTMSIFFTTLSFPDDPHLVSLAKLGITVSSIASALLGSAWIWKTTKAYKY